MTRSICHVILSCVLAVVVACGASDEPAGETGSTDVATDVGSEDVQAEDGMSGCGQTSIEATDSGIIITNNCDLASVVLRPSMLIDGAWVSAESISCTAEEGRLRCSVGDVGTVTIEIDGATLRTLFEAAEDLTVEAFALEGTAEIAGVTAWLSNGFQSWSESGVLAIADPVDSDVLEAALSQRGDEEVMRNGRALSWWYSFASAADRVVVAGALSADRFRPWVQFAQISDSEIFVRIAAGGAGERVVLGPGDSVQGETWLVEVGDDPHDILERYAALLPSRRHEIEVPTQIGWNSWYELWDGVDEEAVRANAALALEIFEGVPVDDLGPLHIVVDDGWQREWGEWEPNEKFPSGLDGLAADLRADGFEMGVWLAPLLVDAQSDLVSEHPDWFVQGASYLHLGEGQQRILDVTHPDAAEHLAETIETIVGWGYGLLKIDFLFAGTFEGQRYENVTSMEAYRRALQIIREAAGEETLLLAVGAPGLPSLPWVDAWRVGPDIALEPFGARWPLIPAQARNIASRWHMCLATLCDPDPPILRDLPRNEVEASAWVAALAGGMFFLSDDLRFLPLERREWGLDQMRIGLATGGQPAVPESLVPDEVPMSLGNNTRDLILGTSTVAIPTVWRTPDGFRLAINPFDEVLSVEGSEIPGRSVIVIP